MIRLFASDLDGTLLNERHETDAVILDAIRQVRSAGRYFSIATGRMLTDCLHNNNFENVHIICMNGAVIADPQGKILFKQGLDRVFLKEILETFPQVHFECISPEHAYVRSSRKDFIAFFQSSSIWRVIDFDPEILSRFIEPYVFGVSNEDILKEDILKLNFRIEDPETAAEVARFVERYSDRVVNAPFDDGANEITDISVNKGNAVKKLASLLGLEEEEVAVYGDGGNDLDMLRMFRHAYATSNASQAAKEAAGNVIGDCKDHAVPLHMLSMLK